MDKTDQQAHRAAGQFTTLTEKKRRELWLYLFVSIIAMEILLLVGCIFYSFLSSGSQGISSLSFPWLFWGSMAIIFPAIILLVVHQADVGLFRGPADPEAELEWQRHLPERLQRIYRFIKGAPAVVVLLGLIVLGAALLTLEEALSALYMIGIAIRPHIPILVGSLGVLACVIVVAAVWLNFRTRRLLAEYQFRREVFERTGVIIVDKGSTALPPGNEESPYAMLDGDNQPKALSADAGQVIDTESREVSDPAADNQRE